MTQERYYDEATVPFGGEPLAAAARTLETVGRSDYVLYEHDREWSIGVGTHATVDVFPDRIAVSTEDSDYDVPFGRDEDLSEVIQKTLNELPVVGWRAYGLALFDLARFNYGMPVPHDRPFISLMIPKVEIRITPRSVLLRALDRDFLDGLRSIVEHARTEGVAPAQEILDLSTEIDTYGADGYKRSVEGALEDIHAHRYRKVIISRRVPLSQTLDMVASYVSGRQANAPARSFLLRMNGLEAGGFSPETVAEVTTDGRVYTTPLAGTRSTGDDLMEELELQKELLSDSKEIAEHAISVYIGFQDLSLCCDPTSVRVVNFMIVARRGAVQHLASRLSGQLLDTKNPWHAFNALFPGVTVSGVPKPESVEAIGRHEPDDRELYSGCVMICDDGGTLDATVVLRSFYQRDGQSWIRAGAGVMNMSNPERELEETREKMRSFARYLIEA